LEVRERFKASAFASLQISPGGCARRGARCGARAWSGASVTGLLRRPQLRSVVATHGSQNPDAGWCASDATEGEKTMSVRAAQEVTLRTFDGGDWACVRHCGACCYLGEDERDPRELLQNEQEIVEYLAMIGKDGWCIHLDKDSRLCRQYANRPKFCIVDPLEFAKRYGVDEHDFDEFATECCISHIADSFGTESAEMERFCATVKRSTP